MIIINTKNYKTGPLLLKLAKVIQSHDLHAVMAVPTADIDHLARYTSLPIYAQHVDLITDTKSTGFISAKSIKAHGASGTILNHAEHRVPLPILKKIIAQCKKEKVPVLVCAASIAEAKIIAAMRPEMIAFEDKALIGTGKSITRYQSNNLIKFISLFNKKGIIPICGAGISTIQDVKEAYRIGCKGVLIASAIADNPHPERFLKELGTFEEQAY